MSECRHLTGAAKRISLARKFSTNGLHRTLRPPDEALFLLRSIRLMSTNGRLNGRLGSLSEVSEPEEIEPLCIRSGVTLIQV